MGLFVPIYGNYADEYVHFSLVSCIGNTLLGENYLTRAKLPGEGAEQCTFLPACPAK